MNNVSFTISRMFKLASVEEEMANALNKSTRLLVAGPNLSGKTSLLFEYAMSCGDRGETVLFIAPKPVSRLPLFVNGRTQPNNNILKLINFVYLSNFTELIDFFSGVHLSKFQSSPYGRPKHVIIDEFESYFVEKCSKTEDTTRIAKCLAYMIDAVEYLSKTRAHDNGKTRCHLVMAETVFTDSVTIERLALYKHWITDFLRIKSQSQQLFEVQHVQYKSGTNIGSDLGIHYEITNKAIILKEGDEPLG